MKRFKITTVFVFIFSVLLCTNTHAVTLHYNSSYISLTPSNDGYTKVSRISQSNNINLDFAFEDEICGFDSLTVYLDISNYATTSLAKQNIALVFSFCITSNGKNYFFHPSKSKISGYSSALSNDYLTFSNSEFGFDFKGPIILSIPDFTAYDNTSLTKNSKISNLKISVFSARMSDFYFIIGDIYGMSGSNTVRIADFDSVKYPQTADATATMVPTSATVKSTDAKINNPATTVYQQIESTTKSTASKKSDITQPSTKFKGSGKSYVTENSNFALSGDEIVSESTNQYSDTSTLKASTTPTKPMQIQSNNGALPFAISLIFVAGITVSVLLIQRRKSTNSSQEHPASEVDDEKL